MKRLLIVNVVLMLIVVGLVVQVALLWWRGQPETEPVAPRQAKPPAAAARAPVHRPPPADVADKIAAKDLFDPTRSAPPPEAATAAAEEPVKPLTIALMGVMVASGERQVLVKDQTQPKPIWLREGETIGGYSVARIEPTAVVMSSPAGEEVRLNINVDKGKPGAAPPTGPAGIQPQPTAVMGRPPGAPAMPGAAGVPSPGVTPARPRRGAAGADIKEKIERLREEARRRRGQPPEPAQP